ncbi:hypothetical protein GOM49_04925 [Clostridium bovifaecis]|uniref:Divalent metal cation transporter n=1 Tax=Clostridium bovifaecis TaxID=2184719 RepID=A0A6I6F187_9CLOT|nr:hypothetical protein GOM49_04925 [Clostridium bovifaecis]
MEKPETSPVVREFNMPRGNIFKRFAYILSFVGAGSILMSAAMGPGTLTSCLGAGANYGYMLLWIVVLSGIMNGAVAYIGGKIPAISGKNVFEYICDNVSPVFGKALLSVILVTWYMVVFAQGSAMLNLVQYITGTTGPVAIVAFVITVCLAGYIFTTGKNNAVKLASLMVTITSILYLINMFIIKPDPAAMLGGMTPKLPSLKDAAIVAGLIGGSAPGTSALWYSYSVKDNNWVNPKNLKFIAWDQVYFALLFTIFSVGAFLSAAAVLNPAGIKVTSALSAAKSLEPIAGSFAKWIFSAGFFGAIFTTIGGMATIGAYAITSLFDIGESLNDKKVKGFVWLGIAFVLLGGIAAKNAMSILVNFLGLLNVGGFVIILLLTYYTSSKKYAGEYVNRWYTTLLGVIITLFNLYAVITYITKFIG